MTVNKNIAWLASLIPIVAAIVSVAVWAGDERYVRQEALTAEFDRQRREQLSDEIFELELKVNIEGQLTPREQAVLDRKRRQYEDLK